MKWLALLALISFNASAQTIDTTGNLVNNTQAATTVTSTWQNAKFVQELTCWVNGDPNCSAGQPYLRPDGSINFSYGYTELYQIVNVSKALPNSGTGLVTTGFVFSWRSKNGNSWDGGGLDQLTAYVQGYTKSGKWIENFGYNLNFQHDWTDFNWTQSWSKLRRPDELANVLFGFSGKDNNYWMGPYGPEITNVNFQLKYKPDPCVNNPLYSPDCPKFQETLAKIAETYTVDNSTVKPVAVEYTQDNTATKSSKTDSILELEQPDQDWEDSRLVDTLFKIQDNQQQQQALALDTAASAISNTDKFTQQTIGQAEQLANKLAKQSQEQDKNIQQQTYVDNKQRDSKLEQSLLLFQTASINTQSLLPTNPSQQLNLLQLPAPAEARQSQEQNVEHNKPANTQVINQQQQQQVVNQQQAQSVAGTQQNQQTQATINNTGVQFTPISVQQNQTVELPQQQQNFLTNRADPINSIIESRQTSQEDRPQQSTTQQLRANTADNSLAGGVSLTQLAVAPSGYAQYLNFALQDATFYPSREVYRNQRTVDNARALRQLSSDNLHKQMIDQQWR
jgi:hypothetical protein